MHTQIINEPFRIRCRYRTGHYLLNSLTSHSTVDDLLTSITNILEIARNDIVLYYGYPPKKLLPNDCVLTKHLQDLPLNSGDVINVDTSTTTADTMSGTNTRPAGYDRAISNDTLSMKQPLKSPQITRLRAASDNSCLFTSVLFCVNNYDSHVEIGTEVITNQESVTKLRELISHIVSGDPIRYSEVFLGMPNEEYSRKIRDPDRWGGGIEIYILSQLYEVEICVVDVESCRIDRFGEDCNYPKRIMLLYDGIHYDPLAQERPLSGCLVTVFRSDDDMILLEAQNLACKARDQWAFTDLKSFTLVCGRCDIPLTGQAAAQDHAKETGHTEFKEVKH